MDKKYITVYISISKRGKETWVKLFIIFGHPTKSKTLRKTQKTTLPKDGISNLAMGKNYNAFKTPAQENILQHTTRTCKLAVQNKINQR